MKIHPTFMCFFCFITDRAVDPPSFGRYPTNWLEYLVLSRLFTFTLKDFSVVSPHKAIKQLHPAKTPHQLTSSRNIAIATLLKGFWLPDFSSNLCTLL